MSLLAYPFESLVFLAVILALIFFVPGFLMRPLLGQGGGCPYTVYFESFVLSLGVSGLLFLVTVHFTHSIVAYCLVFLVTLVALAAGYRRVPRTAKVQWGNRLPDALFGLMLIPFGVMILFWGSIHLDGTDIYQHSANIGRMLDQGVFYLPTASARYDLHNLLFLVPSYLTGINRLDLLIHVPFLVYLALYSGCYRVGSLLTGSRWGGLVSAFSMLLVGGDLANPMVSGSPRQMATVLIFGAVYFMLRYLKEEGDRPGWAAAAVLLGATSFAVHSYWIVMWAFIAFPFVGTGLFSGPYRRKFSTLALAGVLSLTLVIPYILMKRSLVVQETVAERIADRYMVRFKTLPDEPENIEKNIQEDIKPYSWVKLDTRTIYYISKQMQVPDPRQVFGDGFVDNASPILYLVLVFYLLVSRGTRGVDRHFILAVGLFPLVVYYIPPVFSKFAHFTSFARIDRVAYPFPYWLIAMGFLQVTSRFRGAIRNLVLAGLALLTVGFSLPVLKEHAEWHSRLYPNYTEFEPVFLQRRDFFNRLRGGIEPGTVILSDGNTSAWAWTFLDLPVVAMFDGYARGGKGLLPGIWGATNNFILMYGFVFDPEFRKLMDRYRVDGIILNRAELGDTFSDRKHHLEQYPEIFKVRFSEGGMIYYEVDRSKLRKIGSKVPAKTAPDGRYSNPFVIGARQLRPLTNFQFNFPELKFRALDGFRLGTGNRLEHELRHPTTLALFEFPEPVLLDRVVLDTFYPDNPDDPPLWPTGIALYKSPDGRSFEPVRVLGEGNPPVPGFERIDEDGLNARGKFFALSWNFHPEDIPHPTLKNVEETDAVAPNHLRAYLGWVGKNFRLDEVVLMGRSNLPGNPNLPGEVQDQDGPLPIRAHYEAEGDLLNQTRIVEKDPVFSGGRAVSSGPVRGWKRFLTLGPRDYYPPGKYTITFRVAARSLPERESPVAILDVSALGGRRVLASGELYPSSFKSEGVPYTFKMKFENEANQSLEFRVYDFGRAVILYDSVDVEGNVYSYRVSGSHPRTVDLPISDPDIRTWYPLYFPHTAGREPYDPDAERGYTMANTLGGRGFLAYGPYVTLPEGKYRVYFSLKLGPGSGVRIDVAVDKGNTILTSKELTAREIGRGYSPYSLDFSLTEETKDVEFRADILSGKVALEKIRLEPLQE